jgi:hypothetical protein
MPVNEKAERARQELNALTRWVEALPCAALTRALAGGVPADAWRAP